MQYSAVFRIYTHHACLAFAEHSLFTACITDRRHSDVARLLTSVAAAGCHDNEYNNNNNGGGGVTGDDADGRRLLSAGKPAARAVSAGDDVDRPLNLEVQKRVDVKPELLRTLERQFISGKHKGLVSYIHKRSRIPNFGLNFF